MSAFQTLRIDHPRPGVARLVLNQPETRNAQSLAMSREMPLAVEALRADASLRVVVVRGEGKAFCAGGDLKMLAERLPSDPEALRVFMRRFYTDFLSIRRLEVPTVAVLHGAAIGAGFCFALACDLRWAASDVKLGLNFVKLGIHPGMAATFLATRQVGLARAMELLVTGRIIDGAEAERLGLVNRAVPPDRLEASVESLVEEILAAGAGAVRQVKRSVHLAAELPIEAVIEHEASVQSLTLLGAEAREGLAAARERRAPKF